MDARAVDQLGDLGVVAIVTAEILNEVEQQLPSHHLVAVHVADILELGLSWWEEISGRHVVVLLSSTQGPNTTPATHHCSGGIGLII